MTSFRPINTCQGEASCKSTTRLQIYSKPRLRIVGFLKAIPATPYGMKSPTQPGPDRPRGANVVGGLNQQTVFITPKSPEMCLGI